MFRSVDLFSRCILSLYFVLMFTEIAPVSAVQSDWLRYGGPNGDFSVPACEADLEAPSVAWRQKLSWGASSIVVDGPRLYVTDSLPGDKGHAVESVLALDSLTGEEIWKHSYSVSFRGKQQTHDEPIQPLATPLVHQEHLFVMSFDGVVRKIDRSNGNVVWEIDLVDRFESTPVQYGFAASIVPINESTLIVAAGGTQTAIVAISSSDGEVAWKSAADEPGYATPVIAELAGKRQVVMHGRDAVVGYDVRDGATLWRYPLRSAGLTNVPTPLVLNDDRILVSGQGCDGTVCLRIATDEVGQTCEELWHTPRSRFFYCNWVECEGFVYGFDSRFFVCMDPKDGRVVWKSREHTDSNAVRVGNQLLLLRGDGLLTLGIATPDSFQPLKRAIALTVGHCWTPPTVVGSAIYVRNGHEIARLDMALLSEDLEIPPAPTASQIDAAMKRWTGKSSKDDE